MVNLLKEMKFKDFMEFIKKRKQLRVYYILLTKEEKKQYKKYVYSFNYKDYIKDLIWQYLNEPKNSIDYVLDSEIQDLMRVYARNKNNIEL
jgi:hypothetical protein